MMLNEIQNGIVIRNSFLRITAHKTTPDAFKLLFLGTKIDSKLAFEKQIVHDLYTDDSDLESKLSTFASEFSPKAINRSVLK